MSTYDIDKIVSPKAIKDLKALEKETGKVVNNILKIHTASAKLDSTLGKMKGDNLNKLSTATKKAANNNEKLKTSTIKLTNLQTNYMKTLSALAKQKERETKKTADQIKQEKDLAIVNSKETGTLEKLAASSRILRRERAKLDLETDAGKKRLKEINKEIDKNNIKIKESSDVYKQQRMGVGGYQAALESTIPALRGVGGAVKSIGTQLKVLLANPVVLILAAITGAFLALKKALTRTEEGQNRMNKAMEVLGAIMSTLMDVVTKVAITLFDAFTKPKKAIKDLWAAIKSNIVVRLKSFVKMFGAIGKVINSAFHLDMAGIKKNAKEAGNAFIDMNTGIENTTGKIKKALSDEGKAISKAIDAAKKKADYEQQYNEQHRKDIKENARLTITYNKQLALSESLKRKDGEKSIEALKKAFAAQKQIAQNEFNLQKVKVNMLHNQAKEAKNDIELNNQVAEAEAELINKKAAIYDVERQLARRLNMVKMEALKQDRERAMAKYNLLKTEFDQEKQANQGILNDTQVSMATKIQILADEWQKEQELNAEQFAAKKAEFDSRLRLGLINQADYDKQIQKLKAEQETADKKARKEHEDSVTKITIKSIKERGEQELNLLNEIEKKKLNELKKQMLAGELTQQEYENAKNEIIYQSGQKAIQIKMANLKAEIDAIRENNDEKIALQQQYNELANDLDDQRTQHAIDNRQKQANKVIKTLDMISQVVNHVFDFERALTDRKLANLEAAKDKEIEMAGDNAAKKKLIEKRYAKEIAKIKTKQAKADKAQALFNIAIKTAEAVIGLWAKPGFPAAIPMTAFVVGLGLLEAATVAAKPIPKFAKGTKNAPEGLALVGEAGKEIIEQDGKAAVVEKPTLTYLKRGAKVYNNMETERIFKEAGSDDFQIRDAINEQTRDIVSAIANKKELHINLRTGTIAERENGYFKEYYNKKILF